MSDCYPALHRKVSSAYRRTLQCKCRYQNVHRTAVLLAPIKMCTFIYALGIVASPMLSAQCNSLNQRILKV